MKSKSILKNPYIQFLLLALVLGLVPTLANAGVIMTSNVTVVGFTIIYSIAALGLNVLLGYSGLVSLGTAGFMGLAAYMSAFITNKMGLPFELSLVVSVAVTTVFGLIIGIFSLKFEGIYLGIATLAVSEVFRLIFLQFDAFTNGAVGASASYPKLLGFMQLDKVGTYYFIVAVMLVVYVLIYNFTKGHYGRALNAMRGSQAAASAMGVNIFKYRLIAFGVANALAAVAGVLYVHYVRLSIPTVWTLNLSLDFLAIIVIGGFRSIYGTLVGSFVVYGMSELVLKHLPIPGIESFAPAIKGILMIIFVLYFPGGLASINTKLKVWLSRRKNKEANNG